MIPPTGSLLDRIRPTRVGFFFCLIADRVVAQVGAAADAREDLTTEVSEETEAMLLISQGSASLLLFPAALLFPLLFPCSLMS